MIDKRLINKLEKALKRLATRITVMDAQGRCLLPEGGADFDRLEDLAENEIVHVGGRAYLMTQLRPQMILAVESGHEDLLQLAGILVETICKAEGGHHNAQDVYRRVMLDELSGPEMDAMAHEHGIPFEASRCVMLFQIIQTSHASAYSLLSELIPQDRKSVV